MKYILLEDLVPAYFKILVTFPINLTEYSRRSTKVPKMNASKIHLSIKLIQKILTYISLALKNRKFMMVFLENNCQF